MLAGVLSKDWQLVGEMMQSDRFHQPYRAELVPHLALIEEVVLNEGGFGAALAEQDQLFYAWHLQKKVKVCSLD
ncbi:hypothetical protein RCO48_16155 [Peribacillus frigoritolerans]|nr:hypothetical protein [Peribacillus frigoritolerans]